MWDFIKNAPILMWVFGAALAAAAWLVTDLALTKNALEDSREEAAKYERIVEVQTNIDQRSRAITRIADQAEDAVEEAENANEPISPDVAALWGTGINSLRDHSGPTSKHDVQGPDAGDAKRRDPN